MAITEYREDIGGGIQMHVDDNGFLRIDGVAAKAGVLTYMLPDGGIQRELVPASTLFDEESLATLIGAPVTVEHPGVLTPDTAAEHSRGSVPNAKADGDKLAVNLVVTGKDAIESVQRGKRQLSPGYKAELEFTPGEYNGQPYDAIQTKRTYNHLAIVQNARGGSECRLHLDSLKADGVACAVEVTQPTTDEVKTMPSVKLSSGATVEVADASTASAIQAELNQLAQRADAADQMVSKEKYDELQGKYDAMSEELKKLKESKEEKMDSDELGAYIDTVERARKLKADIEFKADGKYLTQAEIMASAIGIEAEGKSPEYIQGRFDAAVELAGEQEVRNQRRSTVKNDASDKEPVLTGRAKFIAEQIKRSA